MIASTEVLTGLSKNIAVLESQITIDKAKIKEDAKPLEDINAEALRKQREWKAKNDEVINLKDLIKSYQQRLTNLLVEEDNLNKSRIASQDLLSDKREEMTKLQDRVKANTVKLSKLKEEIQTATELKEKVSSKLKGLDSESATSVILDLAREFNVSIPSTNVGGNGYDDSFFEDSEEEELLDLSQPINYFPDQLDDTDDSFATIALPEDPGLESDNTTKREFVG